MRWNTLISPVGPHHRFLPIFNPEPYASFPPLRLPLSLPRYSPSPPPQGVVPAAEPAHGRSAGLHLRRAAGPQPRRRLDGSGHAVRVVQPAARRHQVLHQRHTQQRLHQHPGACPPHQMPAGGWRKEFKAASVRLSDTWRKGNDIHAFKDGVHLHIKGIQPAS